MGYARKARRRFAVMAMAGILMGVAPQTLAQAATGAKEVAPREESFLAWLEGLRQEARSRGIGAATVEAALRDIEPIPRIIELDRRQPEFTQTFWDYMDKRVTEERVLRGRDLLKKHDALLSRIEREFGVQGRFLVAFWGLESNFGDYTGGFPVVGALATLAYDPRRDDFFRNELLTAMKIIDGGHIAADRMTGSWAGAMGQCQFLPSTFDRFGHDGDGDGQIDIWNSLPDVFASAANFLSRSGWRGDETWGREVRLPDGFDFAAATLDTRRSLAEWQRLGIRRIDGTDLPKADMSGSIVVPAGHRGPAFLVYDNFRTTLVWNRSISYAISVGHLADRIAWRPPLQTAQPADIRPMSRDDVMELQRRLGMHGFDAGPVDGIPGGQTREAIRAFQKQAGMPADGYPDHRLLNALRQRGASDGEQTQNSQADHLRPVARPGRAG